MSSLRVQPDRSRDLPEHFEKRIPECNNRERLVCRRCEFILYRNPKIVASAVRTWKAAKRAIEPRKGFWTLPAGYKELGNTEQAVQRKAREEGCLHYRRDRPADRKHSVARVDQVRITNRARLISPEVAAGPDRMWTRLASLTPLDRIFGRRS